MKPLITTLLVLITLFTYAQKAPSFGKIDKAEVESKECSYEQGAEAECLYDYGEVNYFVNGGSFTNERIEWRRIKVYNEKGLDRANIKVPFYSKGNLVSVLKITGYTYNLNAAGEVEKVELEKNAIYRQKLSESFDEMVFTLPQVKPGSVFEYRYTIVKKDILQLDGWTFQQSIPVRYSKYDVGIPTVLGFNFRLVRRMQVDESTESGTSNVRRKIFEMRNIPSLKKEPYMGSANDYYQRVEFQLSGISGQPLPSATWKGFADMLMDDEDFGIQLKKNVLKNLPLEAEVNALSNPLDKINRIYKFVQKTVAWNGSNNYWCSKGVKQALETKEGNSADINLLLVNLLKDAGIEAYPILVSTRPHGKINASFPFRDQFDNVYAFVQMDNSTFILDASNKQNPFHLIPWDVQFSNGFVVDKKLPQIFRIGDVNNKHKLTTVLQTEINEEGNVKGVAKTYASEYAKIERLKNLDKGNDAFKEKYYTSVYKDYTFDSLDIKNRDHDSLGLECTTQFKGELTKSGDYMLYNLNFLTEVNDNPFISDERISTVEFGYNQYKVLTGSITFNESLVPEELPKNIKMMMPDSSIILQRFVQLSGNTISFRIVLQINRPMYFADEYLDFKAFYAALLETLNEQLVFKKKTQPVP
jgi:hypothetical protein